MARRGGGLQRENCHNGNFKNSSPHAHRSNVVQSAVHIFVLVVLEVCAGCAGGLCWLRWRFAVLRAALRAALHDALSDALHAALRSGGRGGQASFA